MQPRVLDATRCISYLTIELKGTIAEALREPLGELLYGCDICQDVCPWNKFSVLNNEPAFQPHPDLLNLRKADWEELTEDVFQKVFKNSPVKRTKFSGLKRNIDFIKSGQGI